MFLKKKAVSHCKNLFNFYIEIVDRNRESRSLSQELYRTRGTSSPTSSVVTMATEYSIISKLGEGGFGAVFLVQSNSDPSVKVRSRTYSLLKRHWF